MRNPPWTRDELILALALYFRFNGRQLDATHPDVIALSSVLNSLDVHDGQVRGQAFRNPNGVAMKLGNFAAIDPSYSGTGLVRGNHLERVVWDEFAGTPEKLYQVADVIRQLAHPGVTEPIRGYDPEGVEEEFSEGKLLTRLHLARERSRGAVRRKKEAVLKAKGRLACECCGFDFAAVYGSLGDEFTECHHRVPLSQLCKDTKTRLQDLAIVCANCHRMLHRARPVISVEQLREVIDIRRSDPGLPTSQRGVAAGKAARYPS